MSWEQNKPFSIPQIRFVPEKMKPWIVILFMMVLQCTGGIYMAAVNEIVGSTQLLKEDVMMAGFSSLIGMALYFVLMFRLKSAVRPKTTLSITLCVLILANLICMHTESVLVLVTVCCITGFFRLWAIFELNSTIQLWLTPKRDMSVFFTYIFLTVNAAMQIAGLGLAFFSTWASWHYMHWVMIALLMVMWLAVLIIYRDIPIMPRLPLLGIDWIGMLMWGTTAMSALFVLIYGEHYDWWQSEHICFATVFGAATLGLNLLRASFIRHPYISLKTLMMPIVSMSIIAVILANLLLAPSHIFELALMGGVLGYDGLNVASLNYVALAGIIVGAIFTWRCFAIQKWTYQRMLVIGFSLLAIYLAYFYFCIDYNIPKEALMLPVFVRSVAQVLISTVLLTSITRLPFPLHFTQGVCMHNLFSSVLAANIGTAIVGRWLNVAMKRNSMLLGERMDSIELSTSHTQLGELYGMVQIQSLLESMKEIYGWLLFVAIVCLIGLMLRYSGIRPTRVIEPTYQAIHKFIRSDIRLRLRLRRRNRALQS